MVKNCLSECWEMDSPPPDSILWLPPPPVPQLYAKELLADTIAARNSNVAAAADDNDSSDQTDMTMTFSCGGGQFCDWSGYLGGALIAGSARNFSYGDDEAGRDSDYRQSVVRAANNFILQNGGGDNWPLNDENSFGNRVVPAVNEPGTNSSVWFLVLILAAIFSVIVASLLAMFLLKVKEFISKVNGYPLRTNGDGSATLAASMALSGSTNYGAVMSLDSRGRRLKQSSDFDSKTMKKLKNNWSSSASSTTMSSSSKDERYLWTTLTPKGQTHHYLTNRNIDDGTTTRPVLTTGSIYQGGFNFAAAAAGLGLSGADGDIYENAYEQIIDRSSNYFKNCNGGSPLTSSSESPSATATVHNNKSKKTGQHFIEYSYYEDPTPLIESYQLSNMENRDVTPPQSVFAHNQPQYSRRNDYFGTINKSANTMGTKPRVSTPTRIDNPNLPPLNLYPTNRLSTLRRQY